MRRSIRDLHTEYGFLEDEASKPFCRGQHDEGNRTFSIVKPQRNLENGLAPMR
jgi:hypothetical protein